MSIGVIVLAWFAAALVYVQSARILALQYEPEARDVIVSSRAEVIAEGERLSRILGCFDGCHGERLQGAPVFDTPLYGRIQAPNLTVAVQRYSLPEFEAIVRQGIRPDGTSVFGMPSSSFALLTDLDYQAIASFIAQYSYQPGSLAASDYGLLARYEIVRGPLWPEAERRVHNPWRGVFRADETRLGEYLSTAACAQCHGADFKGVKGRGPSLKMLVDYNRYDFGRLLELGAAPGDREVGFMTEISRKRYGELSDDEMDAMYAYLKALW